MARTKQPIQGTISSADELQLMLTPVMQAAFLARFNVLVNGRPGYGKTEIPLAMARHTFGNDSVLLFPCSPSVRESDILGFANPMYMIDPQAEQKGFPYWITKNTPVDERFGAVLLDEISRFGDLGSDAVVHIAHDASQYHRPVLVATSNWQNISPRTEALRDRFPFTIIYEPTLVDVQAVMMKPAIETWEFDLPSLEDVNKVRGWTDEYMEAHKNPDFMNMYKCAPIIVRLLTDLSKMCEGTPYEINNRRVRMYEKVIYTMGCYYADDKDFEIIPAPAYDALSYMYPVTSLSESLGWHKMVLAMVDIAATEIAEFQANAYAQWKQIIEQTKVRGQSPDQATLENLGRALGAAWAANEKELKARHPNDPRVNDALRQMQAIYRRMLRGDTKI